MLYADALALLSESAKANPLSVEQVDFSECLGRRVSRDIQAMLTIPPFDNSAVDGYCFSSDAVSSANQEKPIQLSIVGTLFPGDTPPSLTPPGSAWEIMTGAPFPLDCDCSVKVEDTAANKNSSGQVTSVSIKASVASGDNVRKAGADFSPGTVVISRGEKIRPEHLMALASNGIQTVEVFRKARVVIVPTGAELVPVGQPLASGQIYNSTQPYLVAALSAMGCQVEAKPIVRDEPEQFELILTELESNPPDLLITTGAVSMGKADFVRPSLEKAGARIAFHRVEIRPGKPILFARFKKYSAFGLPGNPVSSVVGVRFFIEPYLRALMGVASEKPMQAILDADYKKPEALRCFLKAKYEPSEKTASVTVLNGQPSFMTKPLLQASSWAVVPEGLAQAAKGTVLHVYPQTSEF